MRELKLSDIDPMLATDYRPFSRAGWIFQLKYDGYRMLASRTQLLTRQKKDATTWYPQIVSAFEKLRGNFIIDGKVCLVDEKGIPRFEAMRGRGADQGLRLTYYAFDLLFANGEDLRDHPLIERKAKLRKLLPHEHPRVGYIDYLETEGEALFAYAVALGMEGIIGKRADSPYVGGRSRDWLKGKQPGFHDGWERPLTRPPAKGT